MAWNVSGDKPDQELCFTSSPGPSLPLSRRWRLEFSSECALGRQGVWNGSTAGQAHSSLHSKTSFEKNCFSAWASTLNMGLINKVDMVCLSPVGYGV